MSHRDVDRRIAGRAAANHGVFSREMAVRAGATAAMIKVRLRAGRWLQVHRSVYVLAGAPRTWHQAVLAACLASGPAAVASHRSAGALWLMAGVAPGAVEVSIPRGRRVRRAGITVHETHLPRTDVASIGPIPITTPARTLIDLASCLPRDTLEEALDDALARALVGHPALQRRSAGMGPRPGIATLRSLLAARDPDQAPAQSPLETQVQRFLDAYRFPRASRQHPVTDGRRRAFLDFAWPERRLGLEVDGYRYHAGRRRWLSDRERLNMLTLLGWRVIHVTARDLRQPAVLAERIWAALGPVHHVTPSPVDATLRVTQRPELTQRAGSREPAA